MLASRCVRILNLQIVLAVYDRHEVHWTNEQLGCIASVAFRMMCVLHQTNKLSE